MVFNKLINKLPKSKYFLLLSLFTSFVFVISASIKTELALIIGVLSLLIDVIESSIINNYNLFHEKGRMIDVIIDRLSEGIMLIKFFTPWFHLFVINSLLTLTFFRKNKHPIIPLRPLFVLFYLFNYVL